METIQYPQLIPAITDCSDWDEWLDKAKKELQNLGYKKCPSFKADFGYFKTVKFKNVPKYQIGVLLFDFRQADFRLICKSPHEIHIQYDCTLCNTYDHISLSVHKDIPLQEFETMAKAFYKSMKKFIKEAK